MNGWRSLSRALPWLLAPALLIAACGKTDDAGGGDTGAGGEGGGGAQPSGGTTLLPMPTAGKTGRGGSEPVPQGGEGGTVPMIMIPGISEKPTTVMCGGKACQSVGTLLPNINVNPCCADGACGVNTQFLAGLGVAFADQCQATGQPGKRDQDCPTSDAQVLPIMGMSLPVPGFVGCCRAETGTCGVIVDQIAVSGFPFASPQLGCVDSAPFFANKPGVGCGDGAGGAGGAGPGAAGAGAGGVAAGGEAGAAVGGAG